MSAEAAFTLLMAVQERTGAGTAGGAATLRRSRPWLLAWLAALALLLQVDAVVKSTLMTALAPTAVAMPECGQMAGMAMAPKAHSNHGDHHRGSDANARCPYCAAAAHAPVIVHMPPLQPSSAVSFAAYRLAASFGPRGPPPAKPRARGPPQTA